MTLRSGDLVKALAADAAPVRRLASPMVRLGFWLAVSATYAATIVAAMGLRADLSAGALRPPACLGLVARKSRRGLLAILPAGRRARASHPARFPLLPEHSARQHRSRSADPSYDPPSGADRPSYHQGAGCARGRSSGRDRAAAFPCPGCERHDPRLAIRLRRSASGSRCADGSQVTALAGTRRCRPADWNLPD